jgi:hypothetical protein
LLPFGRLSQSLRPLVLKEPWQSLFSHHLL